MTTRKQIRNVLTLAAVAMAILAFTAIPANAAQLRFDDFEAAPSPVGAPANWVDNGFANALTDVSGSDGLGGDAGKGVRVRSTTGGMRLITPLLLATGNGGGSFDTLTLTFDASPHTVQTLFFQYSKLGDFSDAVTFYDIILGVAPYNILVDTWLVGDSVTLTDGAGGIDFSDTANIRITHTAGGNPHYVRMDNIDISAAAAVIPEPSTFACFQWQASA